MFDLNFSKKYSSYFQKIMSGAAISLALSVAVIYPASADPLKIEATNNVLDWNAVAIGDGHIFVSGPRWAGFPGPAVGVLTQDNKQIQPYPNIAWNSWKPGDEAKNRFVCANALHMAPDGTLWVVDAGAPAFGQDPVPDGPKLVKIDPKTGKVLHVYLLGDAAPAGSYIDDVRFNSDGKHAYMTDTGNGAIVVLDIKTGKAWRALDKHPSTQAHPERPILVEGKVLKDQSGQPAKVNVDPLEVSPDGKWLYFGPVSGPWSRIPTALLDDPQTSAQKIADAVEPWADLPSMGGSIMDGKGNFYFTNLEDNGLYRRDPSGKVVKLITDKRIHWADAPFLADDGQIWLPVSQVDHLPMFNQGKKLSNLPFLLVSIDLPSLEEEIDKKQ